MKIKKAVQDKMKKFEIEFVELSLCLAFFWFCLNLFFGFNFGSFAY